MVDSVFSIRLRLYIYIYKTLYKRWNGPNFSHIQHMFWILIQIQVFNTSTISNLFAFFYCFSVSGENIRTSGYRLYVVNGNKAISYKTLCIFTYIVTTNKYKEKLLLTWTYIFFRISHYSIQHIFFLEYPSNQSVDNSFCLLNPTEFFILERAHKFQLNPQLKI